MPRLSDLKAGQKGHVLSVGGKPDFQRRITAVGVTPGGRLTVLQNEKKYPLLVSIRNTALAINRNDCEEIMVEVEANE